MFWHLYKYRVKVMLKNKYLFFWMGMFPIILGTLFYMTFSNITEQVEGFSTVNVVISAEKTSDKTGKDIVDGDEGLKAFLDTMEEEGYFVITYAEYDEALELVNGEKADGIVVLSKGDKKTELSLLFGGNGISETILKNIINVYVRSSHVIDDAIATNPSSAESVIAELYSDADINKDLSVNAKNMDPYNQYFFALFAMVCMFGSSYGMLNTEYGQADQSALGARRCVAPTKKLLGIISEFFAAVTVIELMFVILFIYLTCILGVNLGDKYALIFLASIAASLLGVALGYAFGVLLK